MIEVIVAVITEGAPVVLVCITGYYAWLTNKYVRLTKNTLEENRQMRLDAQKPKIAIYLHTVYVLRKGRSETYLRIENIGPGPAHDIHFETDPSFKISESQSIGRIPIFVEGINYLQPRGQKNCWIDTRLRQTPLKIAATYKDLRDNEYAEYFCIDFNEIHGVLDTAPDN